MIDRARRLMLGFARRTGLAPEGPQRRYLWTDAFAVCNFFALGEPELARALIDQVHHTLGRHRADDRRSGWLSGLGEREGAEHPTRAGLRIGKRLPERAGPEPLDDRLEWDRDGQYFHYLTRWMHALDVAARRTGEPRYTEWARELAGAAFAGFVSGDRMAWKMSVDLSRPLVPTTGLHDPLDGLITYTQIDRSGLAGEIRSFASMLDPGALASPDPLGIGGLLADAFRLVQLDAGASLVPALLEAARAGLVPVARAPDLRRSAPRRLGFRELGLAIGLAAVERMRPYDVPGLDELSPFLPLGEAITSFWLEPAHQSAASWREHLDINEVMLATALVPHGYLELPSRPQKPEA